MCFFSDTSEALLDNFRSRLDELNLMRVWAWGHPQGARLRNDARGSRRSYPHIAIAKRLGAGVMRICAGGRATRPQSWAEHKTGLLPLLRKAVAAAERHGVVLALENHVDLLATRCSTLSRRVGSPWLRVLSRYRQHLACSRIRSSRRETRPYGSATRMKDIAVRKGIHATSASWPSDAARRRTG